MNNLVIDFETRSECDLKKCGAHVYASHPTTTILCMGFSYQGGYYLWKDGESLPAILFEAIHNADRIVAHNYMFEYWIWNIVGCDKFLFPAIPANRWDCTMSRALALSLPRSLGKLSEAIGLDVQKDMKGNRVMLKLSKPRKPTQNNPDLWHDNPEDFKILYDYCVTDVKVQTSLDKLLYRLSDNERKTWVLDFKINNRGIPVDINSVLKARSFCERYIEEQNTALQALTGGRISSAGQVAVILEFCNSYGVELTNLSKASVGEALKGELPDVIRNVLTIRKNLSKSSIKKLDAMFLRSSNDNRIRGGLVYHAASTGRWGGSGIQIQNFPRPTIENPQGALDYLNANDYDTFVSKYPDVLEVISSCLRYFVKAPEGKEFVVSDFSAIEARVVFWLAKSKLGMDQFASGRDIYVEMAARILSKRVDQVTKDERQLGKQAILGCGYGMGHKKFKITCENYGMGISAELAKKAVETYRSTYLDIPKFWYGVEEAAVKAVRTDQVAIYNNIKFKVIGAYLFCQLPSGRKLAYRQPLLKEIDTPWGNRRDRLTFLGVDSLTKKWIRQDTYGGKLVENITQACARDIMVNSMLNIEAQGHNIIFTVHDELVCETPVGGIVGKEFDETMAQRPEWAQDLPLKVETYLSDRYKK